MYHVWCKESKVGTRGTFMHKPYRCNFPLLGVLDLPRQHATKVPEYLLPPMILGGPIDSGACVLGAGTRRA